jgi:predicted kinase
VLPPEVLTQRLESRSGDIADATVAVLEQQVMEPFSSALENLVKIIDTTLDVPAQIAAIVRAEGPALAS